VNKQQFNILKEYWKWTHEAHHNFNDHHKAYIKTLAGCVHCNVWSCIDSHIFDNFPDEGDFESILSSNEISIIKESAKVAAEKTEASYKAYDGNGFEKFVSNKQVKYLQEFVEFLKFKEGNLSRPYKEWKSILKGYNLHIGILGGMFVLDKHANMTDEELLEDFRLELTSESDYQTIWNLNEELDDQYWKAFHESPRTGEPVTLPDDFYIDGKQPV
jgi:hypothetical protein